MSTQRLCKDDVCRTPAYQLGKTDEAPPAQLTAIAQRPVPPLPACNLVAFPLSMFFGL